MKRMSFKQSLTCWRAEERARAKAWGRINQVVVGCLMEAAGEGTLAIGNINCLEVYPVEFHGSFSQSQTV